MALNMINTKELTTDKLIRMKYTVETEDRVWAMSENYLQYFIDSHLRDGDGHEIYQFPVLSTYGTLLGLKIVIVDFDYIGVAKI